MTFTVIPPNFPLANPKAGRFGISLTFKRSVVWHSSKSSYAGMHHVNPVLLHTEVSVIELLSFGAKRVQTVLGEHATI